MRLQKPFRTALCVGSEVDASGEFEAEGKAKRRPLTGQGISGRTRTYDAGAHEGPLTLPTVPLSASHRRGDLTFHRVLEAFVP